VPFPNTVLESSNELLTYFPDFYDSEHLLQHLRFHQQLMMHPPTPLADVANDDDAPVPDADDEDVLVPDATEDEPDDSRDDSSSDEDGSSGDEDGNGDDEEDEDVYIEGMEDDIVWWLTMGTTTIITTMTTQ
jgi:hypothetical protein